MAILPGEAADFAFAMPVIVAGGGATGLVAALAAHDGGAEVAVLEREPVAMGSSGMSLGALCASGTAEQRRHGIDDSAEIFLADVMAKTGGTADAGIAALVGGESGPALDWLQERHNVPLLLDPNWPPAFGHSRSRMHVTPGRSGADLMERLGHAVDEAGIPLLTNATLTDIFSDGERVLGVRYSRPDGSVEDIGCAALVLATCGFGANAEAVARYIPEMAQARYFGWEANRGDGIWMGAALGGALGDMDAYQGLGLLADPAGIDVNPRFVIEGGIQVNREGRRFSNEVEDVSGQGARVIAQPGGIAYVIYDGRIHASCEDLPQYRTLRELGGMVEAETLTALAERLGIDAVALEETVAACAPGAPDPFGRRFMTPALAGPFHAIRVTGALFHTQGGLQIDDAAGVLRSNGSRIANLFAGGGAARGISGKGPSGYLPGAGLCAAITLGRIAGRSAAALARR